MYYGWWVLTASVVIELFGIGFGIFAVTSVYPYLIDSFPTWPRSTIFLATSIIILTAGALAPFTGWIIDRFPIRRLFVAGIVVQSGALLAFSRVQTPAGYLLASALIGVGLSGVTILPNQVLVSRWFHARIGLVNGILLAATALGAAVSPALVTRLIESVGDWRVAFVWVAALAFGPPMLVVLLLVRDRPESMGLRPYGADQSHAAATSSLTGRNLPEALRSRSFWALATTVFLVGLPCYSFNKHILVFLSELGYERIPAADLKSLFFAVSGCARFSFGWLCDTFDRRRTVVVHLALIALAYPAVLLVPAHPWLLVPALIVLGLGYGGLLPTIPIMTVHLFGRAHLGAILGWQKVSYDVAAALAPVLTAHLYDLSGGYLLPQRVNAGLAWAGLAIAAAFLGRDQASTPGAALR